jgi:transposase
VELGVVEQRYRAVLDVLEEGASVTEVARRHEVARQTVHEWLARYAAGGLGGLADRSSRPASCPHQMPAQVEARIVGMRRDHPGWGPSRIVWELERAGVVPLPGRSAVYRALIRHGLVDPKKRCTEYPLIPVLVTSRLVGYDQARLDDRLFIRYRIGGFAEELVADYVGKWFA